MSAGKDVGVSCPLAAWRGRRKCLPLPPSLSRLFIFPPLSPRSTFLVFGLLESQNPDLGPRPIPSWLAARARPRLQAPPLPGGHHGRSSAQPPEFTEAAASSPSPLGPEMGTEETGSSDSRHQVCPGPEPATAPGHFPGKQHPGGSVVSRPSESGGAPRNPAAAGPYARGALHTRRLLPPARSDARGGPLSLLCGGHDHGTLKRVPAARTWRTFLTSGD